MKTFLLFAAVIAASLAKSVTLLKSSDLTGELVNNPRYLLHELDGGIVEVEDLETSTVDATLFATDNDVSFYVYTPENPSLGVQMRASELGDIVKQTRFNLNRDTLVIIHGWKNKYDSPVNEKIKNAALLSRNINVIVVDWSPIASKNYISAQKSVLAVGSFIGEFLVGLQVELNYPLTRVTVAGHSLGAHIAGNAGAKTNGQIPVIIGLDPAGPLFSQSNSNNRLDPTDAGYVQIIQTNDGLLGFGIKMGNADYYPNGGKSQPGCGIDATGSCAHGRAFEYFAESLNNNNFLARLCTSYSNFQKNQCSSDPVGYLGGYPVGISYVGDYFLVTNSKSPYAQG